MRRRAWFPAGRSVGSSLFGGVPEVGQMFARPRDRRAGRVTRLTDIHQANWLPQTTAFWRRNGAPAWETWPGREIGVMYCYDRSQDTTERAFLLVPWHLSEQWIPLDDPYPTCVDCGLVWPCYCVDTTRETNAALAELDRVSTIAPGCCWGCGEPITTRQRSIAFDGDNLLLPGAPPAVFHTRAKRIGRSYTTCWDAAHRYEELWVAAVPGRERRLTCPGLLRRHRDDGTADCTAGRACPSYDAHHADAYDCTARVVAPNGKFGWSTTFKPTGLPLHDHEVLPVTVCSHKHCRGRLRSAVAR